MESLCDDGRQLKVEMEVIIDHLSNPNADLVHLNVALKISNLTKRLTSFVESLSKQQRTPATHIWVIMISPEDRRRKPYALPVQCIPYSSLTAVAARDIINSVIKIMKSKGMDVAGIHEVNTRPHVPIKLMDALMNIAGLVTDGEFNTFRARGSTRPVSIFAIRSDARAKYSRLGKKTMLSMITPKCMRIH